MFLKICGITTLEDAAHAVRAGATALGFVLWPQSPRHVDRSRVEAIVASVPPEIVTVGVFVNESAERLRETMAATGLTMAQLHGDEPAEFGQLGIPVLRSATLATLAARRAEWGDETLFLLDAADPVRRGGTGQRVDWDAAARAARTGRLVLAGGLDAENVEEAVRRVRPFGVDVSSGVETAPGRKDPEKVARFLANARRACEAMTRGVVTR